MKRKEELKRAKKAPAVIGIIVCILLTPILIMSIVVVIKSFANPNKVPDFFGIKLFIIRTKTMEPEIRYGDLIISKKVNPAELKIGDIISFREENIIVTHRILEFTEKEGNPAFITTGDNSGENQGSIVVYSQVEGMLMFKIPGFGRFVLFTQTPQGLVIFIGVPLFGFILYSIIRSKLTDKKQENPDEEKENTEEEGPRGKKENTEAYL